MFWTKTPNSLQPHKTQRRLANNHWSSSQRHDRQPARFLTRQLLRALSKKRLASPLLHLIVSHRPDKAAGSLWTAESHLWSFILWPLTFLSFLITKPFTHKRSVHRHATFKQGQGEDWQESGNTAKNVFFFFPFPSIWILSKRQIRQMPMAVQFSIS